MYKNILFIFLILMVSCCASQPNYTLVDGELETSVKETLKYYLYYPPEYELEPEKEYPVLLFLHGGGEVTEDLGPEQRIPPPSLILQGKKFPFLILAPENSYAKSWWNTRAVKQLLDSVVAKNRIDRNRIYLSGISRGGGAAWEMVVQYPETFAAMAVVCGMTPLPYATWINKKMPIWVFHGEDDTVIPVEESQSMVNKLKEFGYDVRFTKYENVGHNAWSKAFATKELYDWFLRQKIRN